jgi:ABC-type glutathione transport system ATPase component
MEYSAQVADEPTSAQDLSVQESVIESEAPSPLEVSTEIKSNKAL